ncbi:MAG: exostosin family protein [Candidatus Vogelbacteria bacterium]|nr:exostosin family protein [Candidatus Vogelbacteria bacterium]
MLKVYTGKPLFDQPHIEALYPNWGRRSSTRWSDQAFKCLTEPVVEVVSDPTLADYLLLPHNWNLVKNNKDYLADWENLIKSSGKKIIVFNPGDDGEPVKLKNAIIFRHSQYQSSLLSNEIIMPGYVEDLGVSGVTVQTKRPKPIIGFCGWAKSASWWQNLKTIIKAEITYPLYKRQGLFWRKRILGFLKQSNLIDTNLIIRGSYSGNEKTIELDPKLAREEYINNVTNSDFTLCVRGDGNFSTRFYEVLSLGRLPLFIDTDCVLPLEDKINYDEIMVRVNYLDLKQVDQIISQAYQSWSEAEYAIRQQKAREIFEQYLRLDKFLTLTLTKEFLRQYA